MRSRESSVYKTCSKNIAGLNELTWFRLVWWTGFCKTRYILSGILCWKLVRNWFALLHPFLDHPFSRAWWRVIWQLVYPPLDGSSSTDDRQRRSLSPCKEKGGRITAPLRGVCLWHRTGWKCPCQLRGPSLNLLEIKQKQCSGWVWLYHKEGLQHRSTLDIAIMQAEGYYVRWYSAIQRLIYLLERNPCNYLRNWQEEVGTTSLE